MKNLFRGSEATPTLPEPIPYRDDASLPAGDSKVPSDIDPLALSKMTADDVALYDELVETLQNPATELEARERTKPEAIDAHEQAANELAMQGFYLKAALLKSKTAKLAIRLQDPDRAERLFYEAIELDLRAHDAVKEYKTQDDYYEDEPIRANFPNLFLGEDQNNHVPGKLDRPSSQYVIFSMVHSHYLQLMHTVFDRDGKQARDKIMHIKQQAEAILMEINPDLTKARLRVGALLPWSRAKYPMTDAEVKAY